MEMILIYDKTDLIEHSINKNIRDIELQDIRFSAQTAQLAIAIIYVDREVGLMRVMKHKYVKDFNPRGLFSLDELPSVINDGIKDRRDIGKSILKPGTRNKK